MNPWGKSQHHLEIIDIKDNIVVLRGGRFRMVVETTAINFDLLSEDEQNATIFAYANLVNSLDYPIQTLVRTRQVDITAYIAYLHTYLRELPTSALKEQMQDYIAFIEQLVLENTVLQKRFFVVIPHWSGPLGPQTPSQSLLDFLPLPGKNKAPQETYSEEAFEKAKRSLNQRQEELRWQFRRLGIQIKILTTEELIRLYYEIYNPESGENRGLQEDPTGYMTGMVRSSLKKPENADTLPPVQAIQSRKENK